MPSRDDYMNVAQQIANHLNSFHLAFKTYNVTDLDQMIESIAGSGARISSGGDATEQLRTALLERGFTIYPPIPESQDGYIRVIRTNSKVGNLLNAFRYVGPNGDEQLARLLNALRNRRRPDDFEAETDD